MLDNHCIHCNEQIGDGDDQPLSSYDFVYLPIDFKYFPSSYIPSFFFLNVFSIYVSALRYFTGLIFINALITLQMLTHSNKCNVGYGFVNMTSPEATLRLYKAFHLQHWEVFNSRKICEVTYARVQVFIISMKHIYIHE